MRVIAKTMLSVTGVLMALPAVTHAQDVDVEMRRLLAPAVLAAPTEEGGKSERWEFNFGRNRGNAWLARKGELFVDTWVQHRGLLCADYEVGVRFGKGNPGCTNVEWLAPAKYVTSRKQCNNALVNHRGADTEARLAGLFEQVTCAEQIVRCYGNCK